MGTTVQNLKIFENSQVIMYACIYSNIISRTICKYGRKILIWNQKLSQKQLKTIIMKPSVLLCKMKKFAAAAFGCA